MRRGERREGEERERKGQRIFVKSLRRRLWIFKIVLKHISLKFIDYYRHTKADLRWHNEVCISVGMLTPLVSDIDLTFLEYVVVLLGITVGARQLSQFDYLAIVCTTNSRCITGYRFHTAS